jgi:alkaline phosphatase
MHIFLKLSSAVLATAMLAACGGSDGGSEDPQVKNVIMMIGDGMGPQQVGLLQEFAANSTQGKNVLYKDKISAIENFADNGRVALSSTGPYGSIVVDSACSATQLATGKPALSEVIGLDIEGNPTETVLEAAKAMGKATGLITDTRVTHATPASFAAHQTHRSLENEIASDMLATGVDVMLGGGLRYWIPASVNSDDASKTAVTAMLNGADVRIKSKRKDERNLLTEAQDAGYKLAFNESQLDSMEGDKVLGLFHYSAMLDGIANTVCETASTQAEIDAANALYNCAQPSLAEMTKKALDILSKDKDGFFLMIEGGQIDWAAHNNDAGDMLHQMLKFDEAIQAVYDWVEDRNDTVVVITADHETGGFGFSYSRKDLPTGDTSIGGKFADLESGYKPNFNFGGFEILDDLYKQKKDFYNIWYEAGGDLGGTLPTPAALLTAINSNSEFQVTSADVDKILAVEANKYQVAQHKYLDSAEFPAVDDFEEFYVYGEEVHLDLIGRKLSKNQNIVWNTGTHTHTPVEVIAWGPEAATAEFNGLMDHVEVGQKMFKVLAK